MGKKVAWVLAFLISIQLFTVNAATAVMEAGEMGAFFDEVFTTEMINQHIPGGVISVVKEGDILFSKGYGYADLENSIKVDPETTMFAIASVTKLFTWTAVMQLIEQGKLDPDTGVNEYIDFIIPDTYPGRPVTMKHLMTHTAGFEEVLFGLLVPEKEMLLPPGEWLSTHIPARIYSPGTYSAYSNYGAALAGYIVERVSGISFQEYLKKEIFTPLEMSHTTIEQPVPDNMKHLVSQSYSFADNKYLPYTNEFYSHTPPAGKILSSATDISRFMIAHLQNGIYKDKRILENASRMQTRLFSHSDGTYNSIMRETMLPLTYYFICN